MKLSVFSPILANKSLEESLKYLSEKGVDALELGCGGYPGTAHADAKILKNSPSKINELKELFKKYNMQIAALSVHGNGVHPNKNIADNDTEYFDAACEVAAKLGVDRVVTFSGCPGDRTSQSPNWVTCAWPPDFREVLEYQWNDVLIPYWTKQAKKAENCGVKVCFEMHPGFCVYNPETMMRLRNAVGDTLGANLDPSHLFWQGIDIVAAIKHLGDAIYFFHAKDTSIDKQNTAVNGVLDTKSFTEENSRAWIFRTVGYGHGELEWRQIMSALRQVGYDYMISIEHEDSLMMPLEGLEKAIDFLRKIMLVDKNTTKIWWA